VIDQVSDVLIAHGTRSEPITLPLPLPGSVADWWTRTITTPDACLAASLLANQPPGTVAGFGTVGDYPQDALHQLEDNLRAVVAGAESITRAAPRIMLAQGNLRSTDDGYCHAIVIAFSIEKLGIV
jgi:hypothetical protein